MAAAAASEAAGTSADVESGHQHRTRVCTVFCQQETRALNPDHLKKSFGKLVLLVKNQLTQQLPHSTRKAGEDESATQESPSPIIQLPVEIFVYFGFQA